MFLYVYRTSSPGRQASKKDKFPPDKFHFGQVPRRGSCPGGTCLLAMHFTITIQATRMFSWQERDLVEKNVRGFRWSLTSSSSLPPPACITITIIMIITIIIKKFQVLEPSSFYPAAWMEQSKLTQGRTKKDWEKVFFVSSAIIIIKITVINIIKVKVDPVLNQEGLGEGFLSSSMTIRIRHPNVHLWYHCFIIQKSSLKNQYPQHHIMVKSAANCFN